ncbi:hypothetical protein AMS68_000137 [Peltaster fructicola]|uniref:F-box domain-containing protein n=1 Tax=Peltaster fructicola TaxID=286661 RepID=A0A6H0XJB4_9PEZI|nr:hypothetical protein AMS68_000137 [Peltaster fructicola]
MATITDLPVELIERIVTLLTTEEVGKLRLTSRELRAKASQGGYLSNFINHNVDLSETSLKALTSILTEDNLSRRLRNLTITTLVFDDHNDKSPIFAFAPDWDPPILSNRPKGYCTSDTKGEAALQERTEARQQSAKVNLRRAQHEVNVECNVYPAMVQQAFETIKLYCQDEALSSLRLNCKVDDGNGPHLDLADKDARLNLLSAHTTYLFSITMDALLSSKLCVGSFDIFPNTRHCSLASTQISPFLARTSPSALRNLTSSIRSLAMSFSRLTDSEVARSRDMCCSCNKRKGRPTGNKTMCHKHLVEFDDEDDTHCQTERSLVSFLNYFANLEALDLRQYEIERSSDKWNPIVFEHIADHVRLPHLKKLTLRGVNADERSLLALLTTLSSLHSLDMRHVNLKDGQWQPIFSYIKTAMPKLHTLNLEDLFENKRADTVTVPNNHGHIIVPPPPPPPPVIHGGFGGGPPPLPAATSQAESYLNTLVAFRVMNVPEDDVQYSGPFKSDRVKLEGASIKKADILYGFIAHHTSKWRLEKKWMAEHTREYGPRPRDIFDIDY